MVEDSKETRATRVGGDSTRFTAVMFTSIHVRWVLITDICSVTIAKVEKQVESNYEERVASLTCADEMRQKHPMLKLRHSKHPMPDNKK